MVQRRTEQLDFVDYLSGPGVSRRDRFFDAVPRVIDWEPIEAALAVIHGSKMGRPSIPPLLLFKILLIQRWYGLGDPAAEDALNDSRAFARFVGLSLGQTAPNYSSISRFRTELIRRGLMEPLIQQLMAQIDAKGLVLREGTLMDATFVPSAARPPSAPRAKKASRAQGRARSRRHRARSFSTGPTLATGRRRQPTRSGHRDPGPGQSLRGSSSIAGKARRRSRRPLGQEGSKSLLRLQAPHRRRSGSPLRARPSRHRRQRQRLHARARPGPARRRSPLRRHGLSQPTPFETPLAEHGLADGIMQLGTKHYPLRPAERRRNRTLAGIRCEVEGVFGEMKRRLGTDRARYFGLVKVQLECDLTVFAFNLKTMALAA